MSDCICGYSRAFASICSYIIFQKKFQLLIVAHHELRNVVQIYLGENFPNHIDIIILSWFRYRNENYWILLLISIHLSISFSYSHLQWKPSIAHNYAQWTVSWTFSHSSFRNQLVAWFITKGSNSHKKNVRNCFQMISLVTDV